MVENRPFGNALAHLASISTSRTLRLNDAAMTGLPAQLVARPGLNSGLGVLQKTVAMLNAHVRYLAAPASLDSMAVAGVIAAIEDKFGIVVDDDDISGATFATFGSLVAFVRDKLG